MYCPGADIDGVDIEQWLKNRTSNGLSDKFHFTETSVHAGKCSFVLECFQGRKGRKRKRCLECGKVQEALQKVSKRVASWDNKVMAPRTPLCRISPSAVLASLKTSRSVYL